MTLVVKQPGVSRIVSEDLGIRPNGIGGPLAKTGAYATGQPSSNGHDGALFTPRRRYPVEALFEHRVTGQRTPRGFDEQLSYPTRTLTADMTTPHGGPRRMLAGCQPRGAEQRSFIRKARHVTQLSRQGPGDHLPNTRDAPIHRFDRCLRLRLRTEQAAYLDELTRGKAPLLGQQ